MADLMIDRLFPRFLLDDPEGYAVAKALEAMLQYAAECIETGVDTVINVDKMPEWRLDQMAWESNALYDYTATVDAKRAWVKSFYPVFEMLGTPAAIMHFLQGYFENVVVEEWHQYGGEPYHFRVSASGMVSSDAEAWARKAIAWAKNVRSVLDGITIYRETGIVLHAEPLKGIFMPVVYASDNLICGDV